MELHNQTLIQKTAWRFITESDSLWVRFLKAKYRVGEDIWSFIADRQHGSETWSYTWRCLVTACKLLSNGLKWRIGNGSRANFWTDPWLLNEPLRNVVDPS